MNSSSRIPGWAMILLMVVTVLFPLMPATCEEAARGPVNNTDSEPNDEMANATIVDTDGTIEGTLVSGDNHDNYKFQLSNDGTNADKVSIMVVFDADHPLVSVYLRDHNGFLLDFMRDTKNTDLYTIGTTNPDAWYYLNVTDDLLQGATYNVTFTFSSVPFDGDANNNPSDAVEVSQFPYNINTTADGDTDPHDHQDLYKIMLTRTVSEADLMVAHMTQEITAQFVLEVFDSGFETVAKFEKVDDPKPGSNQTYSYGPDAPGYYYLRVFASNGSGSYDLTIDVVKIGLNDDNDNADNATAINLIDDHWATISGDVGEGIDVTDYYSLEVMKGQFINLSLTSEDYNATTRLPKMHIGFMESDGSTPYDIQANRTDDLLDPFGYTNGTAVEEGPVDNYIKIFVDNQGGGGGAYSADLVTDRKPEVNQSLIHNISINESTVDSPTQDTSIKLKKLFSDPDPSDNLTFDYMIASDKGMDDTDNFTVEIGDDEDMTVTLTPKAGQTGGLGYTGSGDITFRATDPFGLNETAIFHVRVYGTNHAPYIKDPYNVTGEFPDPAVLVYNETELLEYDLRDVFGDIDQGDQVNFRVNGTSEDIEDPDWGYSSVQQRHYLKKMGINDSFIISFDLKSNLIDHKGTITIRLDADSDKVKEAKAENKALEEDVWFWALDDGEPQKTSEGMVKLKIQTTSPNGTSPKWIQSFTEVTFDEDSSRIVDFDTLSTDIDPVDQDSRTYEITNLSANVSVEKVDRSRYEFSAVENWYGTLEGVLVNCTDSFGLWKDHTFDVIVNSVPDAPVMNGTSPEDGTTVALEEGGSQNFHVDIYDVDSVPAEDLNFNWSLDGIWLRTIVGDSYTYLPSFESAGDHTVAVNVSERENPELFVKASWNITVTDVNRGPEGVVLVEPAEGDTYTEGKLLSLRAAEASDPDGDQLTYTWKIDGEAVSNDRTFETKDLKKGNHTITLEVTDGDITVTRAVQITVEEASEEEGEGADMLLIGGFLLLLVVIVVIAMLALRGKREKPMEEEETDIYAEDRKAMKEAVRKADEEESEEE